MGRVLGKVFSNLPYGRAGRLFCYLRLDFGLTRLFNGSARLVVVWEGCQRRCLLWPSAFAGFQVPLERPVPWTARLFYSLPSGCGQISNSPVAGALSGFRLYSCSGRRGR